MVLKIVLDDENMGGRVRPWRGKISVEPAKSVIFAAMRNLSGGHRLRSKTLSFGFGLGSRYQYMIILSMG